MCAIPNGNSFLDRAAASGLLEAYFYCNAGIRKSWLQLRMNTPEIRAIRDKPRDKPQGLFSLSGMILWFHNVVSLLCSWPVRVTCGRCSTAVQDIDRH